MPSFWTKKSDLFDSKNNNLLFKNVSKYYGGKKILENLNFIVKKNKFTTFLGPSGCGKTTILRMIAGFENPDSGEIFLGNVPFKKIPPYKRPINTIFQSYALFPHMNVFGNIAYGLSVKKIPKKQINLKVRSMLKLVNLEEKINSKIDELSGGEQQRVSIARSLINEPKILLLDEPLSALDTKLRKFMQKELRRIQRETNVTFIFVTHDQEEALTMSDYLFVINNGRIEHEGSPIDIYNEPVNSWVAKFIGASNIIEDATFIKDDLVNFDGTDFVCIDKGFRLNSKVDIVIRPEDIKIIEKGKGFIEGTINSQLFKGIHWETVVETKNRNYVVDTINEHKISEKVSLHWKPSDIHVMEKNS